MGSCASRTAKAQAGAQVAQRTSARRGPEDWSSMGNENSTPANKNARQGARPDATIIADKYESIEEVQEALSAAGLESSDLIVAVDLTKSNESSGQRSFDGKSLHALDSPTNPYKSVISILSKTLSRFDDDEMIPTFGFGDSMSRDKALISFSPDGAPLFRLESVLQAYEKVLPAIRLSGPTSFAPAIYKAIQLVEESGGAYHILVVIADGQVTDGPCLDETVRAIVEASYYPLSIIMVGVGDGPWDKMKAFDDGLPRRFFDNFQFVNYMEIAHRAIAQGYSNDAWEAEFARCALMEIPDQYKFLLRAKKIGARQNRKLVPVAVHTVPPGGRARYPGSPTGSPQFGALHQYPSFHSDSPPVMPAAPPPGTMPGQHRMAGR